MGITLIINDELYTKCMVVKVNQQYVVAMKVYDRDILSNALTLIKEEQQMRNRVLLLCLKNHIETISEYSRIMNIEYSYAEDILTEKAPLTEELISKNCALFKVSKEYLLCQI